MRECFVEQSFYASSRKLIDIANAIIEEYQAKGFSLTLRQLYYQFVARGYIPNKQSEYKRLGEVINKARLAGLIDWDAIEDRTRWLRHYPSWLTPQQWLTEKHHGYREDVWRDQDHYCEVWIEKDALVSVVERACGRWRVPFFACRGYASQSELYNAGKRLAGIATLQRKQVHVFHLGDHDPSGLDMTRDNTERINMFAGLASWNIQVHRLALNMDQIEEYEPPPNPAKETDARFGAYQAAHGDESWELDALDPTVIDELVSSHIEAYCDVDDFNAKMKQEEIGREYLGRIAANFDTVADFIDYVRDNPDML